MSYSEDMKWFTWHGWARGLGRGMLGLALALRAGAAPPPSPPLSAARFAAPPAETRILKIIHQWPGEAGAQDELITRLQRQGFGGVVCNVAAEDYLESEPRWQAFTRAIRAAKAAGMALWLYDEKGYPSAAAGGLTLRDHPEWEAEGWLIAQARTQGGPVAVPLPPGKPCLLAAFPQREGRIDLNGKVDLAGAADTNTLSWQAPPGDWLVLAITESRLYEGTHAEMNLFAKQPYPNLLRPEPTQRFLALTHERYAERLGPDLGRYFESTFTDEPSLMSVFLRPMPYRVLPTAPDLAAEFARRRGYPLGPCLPALVAEAGPETARWRYDYWLTVGELVSERFFGAIQEWCQRHHVRSGGHLLLEEGLASHAPLYGDFFRCIRRLDAPSIDCLTSLPAEVPWYIARLLSSAAELEGRTVVMSETSDHSQRYRPPGDQRPARTVTEGEIRGTCHRLMVSGVNVITSYYSFAGLEDEALRRLNEHVGRCGLMLRGGHQVADIAVVYPTESVWPRFTPSRHWANECVAAQRIEHFYRAASESLFHAGRDFTYVDGPALAGARVEGGVLAHGPLRWRVVVLPGVDTLSLAAWEKLAEFARAGGVVFALGARPTNSERDFPSTRVRELAAEVFGPPSEEPHCQGNAAGGGGVYLPAGAEGLLLKLLEGVLEPDLEVAGDSPLRVTHRRGEGHDLYFLINDSPQAWKGTVKLAAAGPGERWDPARGRIDTVASAGPLALELEGYGATFLRFPKARLPRRSPLTAGSAPRLRFSDLPLVQPEVGRGEFVRETVTFDPGKATGVQPAWQANASLTKGQVDTFLFLCYRFRESLDCSGAACLELTSWVPEGQDALSQLLVVVREEGGGDFLATTGRSLAAAGAERTFLPWTRFQLAGWSKDADGQLDLRRVREVRVGWGGYLGREGEQVRFRTTLPRLGALHP